MMTPRIRWPLRSVLAIAATAIGLGLAAPAHADPAQDYLYYSTLHSLGMVVWNPPAMRALGIGACQDMAMGNNWRITVTKLMNAGYTLHEASMILAAAVVAYCPSLDPRLQDAPPPSAPPPAQQMTVA
ncbi:hypothetical protein JMUB5695_04011 [Mycobacterium heckeshornense]|nr:hypothetical protein JMUB5695_04011 [Mycobacterium heckeshornense]